MSSNNLVQTLAQQILNTFKIGVVRGTKRRERRPSCGTCCENLWSLTKLSFIVFLAFSKLAQCLLYTKNA